MKSPELLIDSLIEYDVQYIFGVPGEIGLPIYDVIQDREPKIKHILARDERAASFMADAYARVSNKPGVCEGPGGEGAAYLIPGIAEAFLSSIPVIAITTDIPTQFVGKGLTTDIDQEVMLRPVTKWNTKITDPMLIPEMVRKAFRIATTGRPGPVQLIIPADVLKDEVDETEVDIYAEKECKVFPAYRVSPEMSAIERAAGVLLEAERPVIVSGGGVIISQAWNELIELSELLSIPVATSQEGKGCISEDHPLSIGVVGTSGSRDYATRIVEDSDLVVFIGCKASLNTTYKWTNPRPGTKRIIHIDVDPHEIGNNYPTEVGIVGDAKLALQALLSVLKRTNKKALSKVSFIADIKNMKNEWWNKVKSDMESSEVPIRPKRVMKELISLLPKNSIIVTESGGCSSQFSSQYLNVSEPEGKYLIAKGSGGLGFALPATIGAKLASPSSNVVGVMGDGCMGFSTGELDTINRLRKKVTLIIFNNSGFSWIKTYQHLYYGKRFYSVDFSSINYAQVAEAFGVPGIHVEKPSEVREAIKQAIQSDESMLIDIVVCPICDLLPDETYPDDRVFPLKARAITTKKEDIMQKFRY
jgi:acetolactate synthase-1/2/3 large subunit